MKSIMKASYKLGATPQANIQRSTFDRSHSVKTTFDSGYLIPIYIDEALPGDTFKARISVLARQLTQIVPLMDNVYLDFFVFSCPNRELWVNWPKFMGERINPDDSIAYTTPSMDINGAASGSLSDYFGLPIGTSVTCNVASFWHRMYNKVWNEHFRDQNLQDSVVVDTDDGPDDVADYVLLRRGKRHDYFTSALPWPQKGEDPVFIPLGTYAPVEGLGFTDQTYSTGPVSVYETGQSGTVPYAKYKTTGSYSLYVEHDPDNTGFPGVFANLEDAYAATINELRTAYQIQRLLERDAISGTRYPEKIKAHFNVDSPDARQQRTEYIGGGEIKIQATPVPQTSVTAATPQGNLAAYAAGTGQIGFNASFTEHCTLMGLVSCRSDISYQQGINKMFLRQTQYDYYWPVFAHLGEQVVENREIFWDNGTPANNTLAWGYQERYAEYRYKPSYVTGLFRTAAAGSLDVYHCALSFASLPLLNDTFIEDDPPLDRNAAVPADPHIFYDSFIQLQCTRPMPVYSVPGYIDHF